MVYITLNELKKILSSILDSWIDEDDESWEWIFQEIEQKCHIGKKSKKKKKKSNIEDDICWLKAMVDAQGIKNVAYKNDINKLESVLKGNIDNVTQLGLTMKDMGAEIKRLRNDIAAAKSMAQTAKQRTEVDYSKYSGKSDGKIGYCNPEDKDCKTCKYYCGENPIDEPCIACDAYQCWEAKNE